MSIANLDDWLRLISPGGRAKGQFWAGSERV
jgi:hypothetical protein